MKKFFYSVLAAATMLFATTSCSQDDEIVGGGTVDNGTTQKVTFTVQMPDEGVASRAIEPGVEVGGGNKANKLIWALYEKGYTECLDSGVGTRSESQVDGKYQFTADIYMVKGLTYNVLFFAYDEDGCAFQLNDTPEKTDLTALTLNDELYANKEGYDAFVKCQEHTVKEGDPVTEVTLQRPFAQINAATTDEDLARATKLGANVIKSQLVIEQVPTKYNILTGEVSEYKDVTYIKSGILTANEGGQQTTKNEKLTVKNTDGNALTTVYNYLNMAYVLAGNGKTTSSTHKATFTFYRDENVAPELVRTIDIINLPIERNWRTNVVGDLLTEEESFKIIIDHVFGGDHNIDGPAADAETKTVATFADLQAALDAANGPTIIKLGAKITGNATVSQKEGTDIVIDGAENEYDGTITIDGNARHTGAETLTLRNINFNHAGSEIYFIECNQGGGNDAYAHNVTVDNCTFTGDGVNDIVGMRYRQCYNMTVKNSTGTGLHSLMWAESSHGITIDNTTAENCLEGGVSLGQSTDIVISNSTFSGSNHGIRTDGKVDTDLIIKNTTLTAKVPLMVRNVTADYNVNLEGENDFITTETNGYQVVFTENSHNAPYEEPTSNYTITGAESMTMFPVRILHEESGLIWNGVTANHKQRFFIYGADDLLKAANYFNMHAHSNEGNYVTIELEDNINLAGVEWNPWSVMWINFNGNGHTISNVKVTEAWRAGFFGYAGAVNINDLTLENVNVSGAQAGILAGSAEGVTTNNVKIAGSNSVTYKELDTEEYGGIGAVTGILQETPNINAEIVKGTTILLDCGAIETKATFVNYLTGYIAENQGTIVNNGSLSVKTASPIVADAAGTGYTGELLEPGGTDYFVLQNSTLTENATITIKRVYSTVVLEGVNAKLDGDVIIAEADNTIILHGCNFTLAEGKKLITTTEGITVGQVMIHDVTVNGVQLTQATAAQYLKGVNWYEVW